MQVKFFCAGLLFVSMMHSGYAEDTSHQESENHPEDSINLELLSRLNSVQVTANRREESVFETPKPVTVVDAEKIQQNNVQTIADHLNGEVGAFIQQTTPGQGNVIIRGLKGSEILHLVDGMRLNTAFFRNAPNNYIGLIDPLNIDRIELVRGPSSTLYGSDAMGGVLHIVTPEPKFEGESWQGQGRAQTIFGSADLSKLMRISGAAGYDAVSISGGVVYQEVGHLRTGADKRLPFTDFSARAGDIKLMAIPGDGHVLLLSASHYEQPNTPRFDVLTPGFGQTKPENAVQQFEPNSRTFFHSRYRFEADNPLFNHLELHAGYQEIQDDRRARDFGGVNEDRERNSSKMYGWTSQFTRDFGEKNSFIYGVDIYQDTIYSTRLRTNIETGGQSIRAPRFPDKSEMDSYAFYANTEWHVSEHTELNLGARYSAFDIHMPASGNIPGVDLAPKDLTSNVGISVVLNENVRWVGNIGRGFRAPNIFDLGTLGARPGNRFNIPNPDLRPETVMTYDTGFKISGQKLQAEIFGFYSDYADKITSIETGEITENGALIVQNRNVTQLQLWGIEAGVRYFTTDTLQWYGTLNFTRGEEEFQGDSYPADRIPPVSGRLGVQYALNNQFNIDGYLSYATRQDQLSPRDLIDPRINPQGTAGHVAYGARLAYGYTDNLKLGLRLENITDKFYREHGSGIDEPGLNVIANVDWQW